MREVDGLLYFILILFCCRLVVDVYRNPITLFRHVLSAGCNLVCCFFSARTMKRCNLPSAKLNRNYLQTNKQEILPRRSWPVEGASLLHAVIWRVLAFHHPLAFLSPIPDKAMSHLMNDLLSTNSEVICTRHQKSIITTTVLVQSTAVARSTDGVH